LGDKGGRCLGLTTLPPSCADCFKSGNLKRLETSGPVQACNGIASPLQQQIKEKQHEILYTKNRLGNDEQKQYLCFKSLRYNVFHIQFPPYRKRTCFLLHKLTPSFISVFNQLDVQNLFHSKFYFMPLHVSSTCAHHHEVKIALHSLWYHQNYRCDDTRGCVMQF